MSFPFETAIYLQARLGLKYLVESGTGSGNTARQCAAMFDRVWTVELNPAVFAKAKQELADCPNVTVMLGQSVNVFPVILPQLDAPTLFWLDGHWVGSGPRLAIECPLLEELRMLGGLRDADVVMIDDARLFLNPPGDNHRPEEWPSMNDIKATLSNWGHPVQQKLLGTETPNDVLMLTR